MPLVVLNALLERKLNYGESIALPYPVGKNEGSFFGGANHTLGIEGRFYRSPRDFLVATQPDRIQFTWVKKVPLPRGTILNLQLEEPGTDYYYDPRTGVTVHNMVPAHHYLVNLAAPKDKQAEHYARQAQPNARGDIPLAQLHPDTPRNVTISSTADDAKRVFRIEGEDPYFRSMVEEIDGVAGGVAYGRKAFAKVFAVTADGPCQGRISVGFGNRLGLPVYLPSPGLVMRVLLSGHEVIGGTIVPGDTGLATARSGDRRGTYLPPEDVALDGAKSLQLLLCLPNPGNIGAPDYAGE
ncbi:MAG: hypothetical protein J0L97_09100 [Alphaproteobacteria bacterium]|nr:hypothetical protein [Alphaproteobacteria bacterium]